MVSLFVKTGKGREELLIEYIIALISKNIAGVLKWGKGQNIGTLKKREQGSMLLSSNYRRNSTYVANIG